MYFGSNSRSASGGACEQNEICCFDKNARDPLHHACQAAPVDFVGEGDVGKVTRVRNTRGLAASWHSVRASCNSPRDLAASLWIRNATSPGKLSNSSCQASGSPPVTPLPSPRGGFREAFLSEDFVQGGWVAFSLCLGKSPLKGGFP